MGVLPVLKQTLGIGPYRRAQIRTRSGAGQEPAPLKTIPLPNFMRQADFRWRLPRACSHRAKRGPFRPILPSAALKIFDVRQYACSFLPCIGQKVPRKFPHFSYVNRPQHRRRAHGYIGTTEKNPQDSFQPLGCAAAHAARHEVRAGAALRCTGPSIKKLYSQAGDAGWARNFFGLQGKKGRFCHRIKLVR